MSFVKDKLREWCQQAAAQKNVKRLRGTLKRTPICCKDNDFPTIIGESNRYKGRKEYKYSSKKEGSRRRSSFRKKAWWSKSKAKDYKSGKRIGPTKSSSQGQRWQKLRGRTSTRQTFRRTQTKAN
ncbi:hypothetical protein ACS0TY_033370 [Phlomoides rotata]